MLLIAPALAVPLDLSVGIRTTDNDYEGQRDQLHLAGRLVPKSRFAAELMGSVRLPGDELSGLTHTLVGIAYEGNKNTTFQQPVQRELGTLGAYAALSPWVQPEKRDVSMWVYGRLGAELRLVEDGVAVVNEDYAAGVAGADPARLTDTSFGLSPVAAVGGGLDVLVKGRVGGRLGFTQRLWIAPEPDYGNKLPDGTPEPLENILWSSTAIDVDVLVRF